MRAVLLTVAGAVLGVLAVLALYGFNPHLTVEMDRPMPRLFTGFYGEERAGRESWAWTRKDVMLTLDGLDRSVPWACVIRLRGGRSDAASLPEVTTTVDGILSTRASTSNEWSDVTVPLPVRDSSGKTIVTLSSSNTFVPGSDRRALGVMVDRWTCAPENGRWALPSAASMTAAAIGGAAFGLAIAIAGPPLSAGFALLAGLTALQALPLSIGFGPFGPFPDTVAKLAGAMALLLVCGVVLTRFLMRRPLTNAARVVACLTAGIAYLKLAGLLHPDKAAIDIIFHAHRLEWVLGGEWFFTQTMPSGVRFPYAIGLYLFAAPWTLFTSDLVTLLRVIVILAEATGSLLLYVLVSRVWKDQTVGAAAAGLFGVVPRTFEIVGNANMTNAFGQSVSLAVLTAATLWALDRGRWGQWIALMLLTTLAFLCHISTFTLLGPILILVAASYRWLGRGTLISQAWSVATAAIAAAILAVALYYARFGDAYRSASRVSTSGAEPGLAAASLSDKVLDAARMSVDALGWPLLLLSVGGLVLLWRRDTRDRLTLTVMALMATFAIFTASVVLAPVEQSFQRYAAEFLSRVTLATYPAMVMCAGLGLVTAWRGGGAWRPIGAVLLLAAIAVGVQEWVGWLR